MNEKERTRTSKFLSLVLRHEPEKIGLKLDSAGWVDVEDPVQLLISGTEGHAVIVDNHLYYRSKHVPNSDSKDPVTKLPAAPKPPMLQFLDALGGAKDQPLVNPHEAAARVVVMEAMYRGAKERKWVNVALI